VSLSLNVNRFLAAASMLTYVRSLPPPMAGSVLPVSRFSSHDTLFEAVVKSINFGSDNVLLKKPVPLLCVFSC
jgi:hypothetical protein